MQTSVLNLERDRYKDLLKCIKDESQLNATRKQSNSYYRKDKKISQKRDSDHGKYQIILPSIESSSLEDISTHFHSIRRNQQGPESELIANKSQQRFIQQSFMDLEQSKMSKTVREISKVEKKLKCIQRKVPRREPLTVVQLEKQLGIRNTSEKQIPSIQRQPQSKRKQTEEETVPEEINVTYFEETLNSYSYAVPSRRESTQIGVVRDRMYVYGGMSGAGITNEMWWFDLKRQEWFSSQSDIELLITSHSMVVWKNSLIIFGGSSYYDHKMKIRQVFSTIAFFNTLTNQWTTSLESVDPRREHKAAILFGKFMVVTGGIDSAEKLLNDTLIYSIESRRWTGQKILFDEGIAQHAVCTAYDYKRSIETIYLFGGQTATLNSFPLMRMLFFGPHPIGWEKIQTLGVAPDGRYNHTMENIGDYLILIGGRSQGKQEYQNEILVYNLQNNIWSSVQRQGLQTKRWSHASCINGTNILCFGGVGEHTYLPPHIYQIETDVLKIKGKIVVVKPLSTINEEQLNNNQHMIITREHDFELKKPCKLEKFRKARKMYDRVTTYLPLPQLKTPKMRYDILIHFVKTILKQINYI